MPSLFNAWYLVIGRLIQVDDFLERGPYRKPVTEVDTPMTIRFRFEKADYDPTGVGHYRGYWTKVEGYDDLGNIWDWVPASTYNVASEFNGLFTDENNMVDVLGVGDFSGIEGDSVNSTFQNCTALRSVHGFYIDKATQAHRTFCGCTNLKYVDVSFESANSVSYLFNDCTTLHNSNVHIHKLASANLYAEGMFDGCTGFTGVPSFDYHGMIGVPRIFSGCTNIQSGIYDMYKRLSSQPGISDGSAFKNCGIDTASGIMDLFKIPELWGGYPAFTNRMLTFRFSDPDFNPKTDIEGLPANVYWIQRTEFSALGNVWDFILQLTSWDNLFKNKFTDPNNEVEIVRAGTLSGLETAQSCFEGCTSLKRISCDLDFTGVTSTHCMFAGCVNLEYVPDLDLTSVTDAAGMFDGCMSLKNVPSMVISSSCQITHLFRYCQSVESGALALYNRLVEQGEHSAPHEDCFKNCGIDTPSGRAELAQIPEACSGM